jgi:hypothetical protein
VLNSRNKFERFFMSNKQALVNELKKIFEHTAEEAAIRSRSNEYLYKGLAWVYLWWVKAKKESGFLEEQYKQYNIGGHNVAGEEKFTRLLRLTWRLDWTEESRANLQQWSNALRKLHVEYESNKDAYRTSPQEQLAKFIDTSGGLRKLIGADKYYEEGNRELKRKSKTKSERSEDEKAVIDSKHLELGVQHFASAKSISNIQSTKPVAVNRMGYALALIRAKPNGTYSVLATVNDEEQIRKAIVTSYKRDNTVAPTVLQLLCEVISTQSIPLPMEPNRDSLQDTIKIKGASGEVLSTKQYKRVLFRKKQKDILLSENRTACSVVTQVKPIESILTSSKDVFLRVQDRRYLEKLIIQQQDLSLYTTNDKSKIPVVRDTEVKASHKLIVEHKLLKTRRAIYFYTLEQRGEYTCEQADVNSDYKSSALWTATVDKHWLENLYVGFVGGWLNEYSKHITRPKYKTILAELGRTQLVFKHTGERGNLTSASKQFEIATIGKTSKPIKPLFLTKDLLPVLANLAAIDIVGNVKISANEDLLVLSYKTALASYTVTVPTCSISAKRNSAAFAAYGA